MKVKISDMVKFVKYEVANLEKNINFNSIGEIIKVFDGVAIVFGLDEVQFNEIVLFENHIKGIVFNIEEDTVGVIILGSDRNIKEGQKVTRGFSFFQVPVGMSLLGRVLNVFGDPLDDKGILNNVKLQQVEVKAPDIMSRKSVCEPVQTGIKIIDSLVPIGRGQRELVIGDRQVGKTSIAIDSIISQKRTNMCSDNCKKLYCIYVAIGQKKSSVAKIVERLKNFGALCYSIIILSSASDPTPLQFYAPYVGCTMGEFFRDNSMHALIIYDDLSKHAVSYRQISLLLRRPPGREAYPGDVFYIHSRLLERAAKLSKELGSGSLTAIPIVETQSGDLSSYIPTNIISITDGQIFLETDLFHKGIRPAVNIGLSVSRIGSHAQIPAMKKISGRMKLDLAQYREIQSFSQFASDLDSSTKKLLETGSKLTELLKQSLYNPMEVEEQVISIFSGVRGFLEHVSNSDIKQFEHDLIIFVRKNNKKLLEKIKCSTIFDNKLDQELVNTINEFLTVNLK